MASDLPAKQSLIKGDNVIAADRPVDIVQALKTQPPEKGGSKGPEPVRYSGNQCGSGDWEVKGRCTDF